MVKPHDRPRPFFVESHGAHQQNCDCSASALDICFQHQQTHLFVESSIKFHARTSSKTRKPGFLYLVELNLRRWVYSQEPASKSGTRNVCTPKFWVPNTLIEGHIPWFRDPKPKGTNPKGTKENSLIILKNGL